MAAFPIHLLIAQSVEVSSSPHIGQNLVGQSVKRQVVWDRLWSLKLDCKIVWIELNFLNEILSKSASGIST
jgi:hypothetical protein